MPGGTLTENLGVFVHIAPFSCAQPEHCQRKGIRWKAFDELDTIPLRKQQCARPRLLGPFHDRMVASLSGRFQLKRPMD